MGIHRGTRGSYPVLKGLIRGPILFKAFSVGPILLNKGMFRVHRGIIGIDSHCFPFKAFLRATLVLNKQVVVVGIPKAIPFLVQGFPCKGTDEKAPYYILLISVRSRGLSYGAFSFVVF